MCGIVGCKQHIGISVMPQRVQAQVGMLKLFHMAERFIEQQAQKTFHGSAVHTN